MPVYTFIIGFGIAIIVMAIIFYLFALPFVNQAYSQTFRVGELAGKAQQNSTIANALIVSIIECQDFAHQAYGTTNGINQLPNETQVTK